MSAKVVGAVLVVLALASIGTIGVAYYNDPSIFDCSSCHVTSTPTQANKISCVDSESSPCCSDLPAGYPACNKAPLEGTPEAAKPTTSEAPK